jgi:hypothetical protein
VVSLSQGDVCLSCTGAVELGVLLPHLAGLIVEEVTVAAGLLLVMARARAPEAACTKCETVSGRVHSRYSRRLADAAIGGRQVEIVLAVRRFFCPAPGCRRKTFAEQVEGLTVRYARETPLLAGVLGSFVHDPRRRGVLPPSAYSDVFRGSSHGRSPSMRVTLRLDLLAVCCGDRPSGSATGPSLMLHEEPSEPRVGSLTIIVDHNDIRRLSK